MVTLSELRCNERGRTSAPDDFLGWRAYHSEDRPVPEVHVCCPACAEDWSGSGSRDEGGLYWPWDLPF